MTDTISYDPAPNHNTKAAFHWIVNILIKLNIPFQITGGLAANLYGASRPLEDIDIDIPEECFSLVKDEVLFIQNGKTRLFDENQIMFPLLSHA